MCTYTNESAWGLAHCNALYERSYYFIAAKSLTAAGIGLTITITVHPPIHNYQNVIHK